jgi:hypothetical protein
LDSKEVPVLPNRLQKVVEKVVEFNTQVIPNEDYVIAKFNLIDGDVLRDLLSH